MVKRIDLRIGNLLYVVYGEGEERLISPVIAILHDMICTEAGTVNDKLEGISLTSEILEACGFEKTYDKALPYQDAYTFEGIILNSSFQIMVEGREGDLWSVGEPFKYLHELQNGIYFLTKKELTLNSIQPA